MAKYFVYLFFILAGSFTLKAQPIGNEGIYLRIYDVTGNDTIELAPNWTGSRAHKINWKNYTIRTESKNSIGFERRKQKEYLCLAFVSGNTSLFLIKNEIDTMRIDFAGFKYPHYTLQIPFQKGHFIFYRPESNQNRHEYHYFPNVNINGVYYGHNITPPIWDMFKVKSKNHINLDDFSFYKMFDRLIPYEALYTGAEVTRHYEESGYDITDSAKAMLFINQQTAELRIIGNNGKNAKAFYGDLVLDTTSKRLLLKPKYGYAIQAYGIIQEAVENQLSLYFTNEETKTIANKIILYYPELYQSLTAPLNDISIFTTTPSGITLVQLKKDGPKAQLTLEGYLSNKTFIRSFPVEIDSRYSYNITFFDHTKINQQSIPTFYFAIDQNKLTQSNLSHWGNTSVTLELILSE